MKSKTTPTSHKRRADQYNDPEYNYQKYWQGREYENRAEEIAIKRLLKGRHFKHAIDVGGGYGRLSVLLAKYADRVTLAEPSQQQLDLAGEFLGDNAKIDRQLLQADDLKFAAGSIDLVLMIRVMHHLPDPTEELAEISRVLSKDGYAIIEAANYMHIRNRLKYLLKGEKMPLEPIDIRSDTNKQKAGEIPFVNHNPHTLVRQLTQAGLHVERTLSVSNLRSTTLKRVMPRAAMLAVEDVLQPVLASTFFGPSIFFLVKKR